MTKAEAAKVRAKIVDYCQWGVANQAQIHYAQIRPIPHAKTRLKALPVTTDCSGFVTMAYQFAGAPDPNGNGYNGKGYTGTLISHGTKVKTPLPGDLLIFADPDGDPSFHVTAYLYTWHGAWVTCSHGGEYGPVLILNHKEQLAQGHPYHIRSYLPRVAPTET